MKIYNVNGVLRRYPEGQAPEGAILVTKAKKPEAVKITPKEEKVDEPKTETKSKARRKPTNKARKAGSNK